VVKQLADLQVVDGVLRKVGIGGYGPSWMNFPTRNKKHTTVFEIARKLD
jgi:hypothetical protein